MIRKQHLGVALSLIAEVASQEPARRRPLTEQGARLQDDTARVDVLDQLAEHVRLELLHDERVVLVRLGLRTQRRRVHTRTVKHTHAHTPARGARTRGPSTGIRPAISRLRAGGDDGRSEILFLIKMLPRGPRPAGMDRSGFASFNQERRSDRRTRGCGSFVRLIPPVRAAELARALRMFK